MTVLSMATKAQAQFTAALDAIANVLKSEIAARYAKPTTSKRFTIS